MTDDTRLGRELAELEATDPDVARSAANLDRVTREIVGAKPFVKWPGGKRALLPQVLPHVPLDFIRGEAKGTYFEPFVGGGALFFYLRPRFAAVGDANGRLIRAYRGLRDDVEYVIRELRFHEALHSREHFYKVRKWDVDGIGADSDVAAWLIYLNKTCFNGIYRVNRAGNFNVPIGRYDKPVICDEANLKLCSKALKYSVAILQCDFAETLEDAKAGDFAYLDPPYVPTGGEAKFTQYTADGFGSAEQERLRDVALGLKRRGCRVVLHNSDTPLVRELYGGPEFTVTEASRSGSISSKKEKRQRVQEVIVT